MGKGRVRRAIDHTPRRRLFGEPGPLAGMKIGPIFAADPDALRGMRGVPEGKTRAPRAVKRARSRIRNRIAAASRARNRR